MEMRSIDVDLMPMGSIWGHFGAGEVDLMHNGVNLMAMRSIWYRRGRLGVNLVHMKSI